jgi:peptidoglycan hydrolase CwlO-like protein
MQKVMTELQQGTEELTIDANTGEISSRIRPPSDLHQRALNLINLILTDLNNHKNAVQQLNAKLNSTANEYSRILTQNSALIKSNDKNLKEIENLNKQIKELNATLSNRSVPTNDSGTSNQVN